VVFSFSFVFIESEVNGEIPFYHNGVSALLLDKESGEFQCDILVFDSSGILIYKRLTLSRKHAVPLFSALLSIAMEMKLGSATRIDFEESVAHLVVGLRNSTLTVVVLSHFYDPRYLIFATYITEKIDEKIKLVPGVVVEEDIQVVSEIVNQSIKVCRKFEDFITDALIKAIEEFAMPITAIGIMKLISSMGQFPTHLLISNPLEFKRRLIKLLGPTVANNLIKRFFDILSEKYGLVNLDELRQVFIMCKDEKSCKFIIRKLIKGVIDRIMEMNQL